MLKINGLSDRPALILIEANVNEVVDDDSLKPNQQNLIKSKILQILLGLVDFI